MFNKEKYTGKKCFIVGSGPSLAYKNLKFPNLKFAKTKDFEIQRGSPGHPEYKAYIEKCMKLAKKAFKSKGIKIFNDITSKLNIFAKKDFLNNKFQKLTKI